MSDLLVDAVAALPVEEAGLVADVCGLLLCYRDRGGLADLQKADWHLKRLIEIVAAEDSPPSEKSERVA